MAYSINPQDEQDSITAFLRAEYPHILFIEGGLPDDENRPDGTPFPTNNEGIISFVLLSYTNSRPTGRGRSFNDHKLDQHDARLDLFVVSANDNKARRLINDIGDRLVGFKTNGGGRVRKSGQIFSNGREVVSAKSSPSRWTRTESFVFGISAKKTA